MRHGLLSWPLIFKYNINAILSSNELSRSLDNRRGLGSYVRLAPQPSHRMLKRVLNDGTIQRLVWLKIDNSILNNSGVLYSDTNATANKATINNDWRNAFDNGDDQAEILIPRKISPNLITILN